MSYKSTRRQWVKLWVNEWLDGTTRFELTAPQRLLWIDLLALAGRSRFPGFVYAGEGEGGKRIGYPLAYLAGVLQMDEVALNNAMKLLELHGHITLEEVAPEQYIIGIINWEKYQSEYLRQKTYRKGARKVTTHSTSRLPVEVEEEGEVEVEGEKRKPSPTALGTPAFLKFWAEYPRKVGRLEALSVWLKGFFDGNLGEILAGLELWKKSEQWKDAQFIPYAGKWLQNRMWKEVPEPAVSKSEKKAKATDAAIERYKQRPDYRLA